MQMYFHVHVMSMETEVHVYTLDILLSGVLCGFPGPWYPGRCPHSFPGHERLPRGHWQRSERGTVRRGERCGGDMVNRREGVIERERE